MTTSGHDFIEVRGVRTEIVERGAGKPILFLHPCAGLDSSLPAIEALARNARVIAPAHPGFGRSELPSWITTVDDLAYFHLDLADQLGLEDAALVGVSIGGWIAADIAVKTTERFSHLVLADAVGVKLGDRESRDVVDIFGLPPEDLAALFYHDPEAHRMDPETMTEEDYTLIARNREATALYAWSPYMHDPKLSRRLHRVRLPTLVLWGESDRFAPPEYGEGYAALIPGARFDTIAAAGHYPHIEQPVAFAAKVLEFVG